MMAKESLDQRLVSLGSRKCSFSLATQDDENKIKGDQSYEGAAKHELPLGCCPSRPTITIGFRVAINI